MKVSTKGRYALEALLDLALQDSDGFVALHGVGERRGLSENYLEQIFSDLRRSGIVTSLRGQQGGYRLARDPKNITVGEIVRPLEGQRLQFDEKNQADREMLGAIAVQAVEVDANRALQTALDALTLQDLLERAAQQIDTSVSYMI